MADQKAIPRPPARVGRPGVVEDLPLPEPPTLTPPPATQPGPRPPAPTDADAPPDDAFDAPEDERR